MGERNSTRAIRIEVPKSSNPNEQIIFDGDWLPASFRNQSYQIARDSVRYVCRQGEPDIPRSRACKIMRNLVDDTLNSRLDMMRTLVSKLDLREREQLQLLQDVATDMFDDQVVSWGRIVTLHAFCGFLARYCEERYLPDCADDVAHILGNIVVNRLGLWIVANGGWVRSCAMYILGPFNNYVTLFNVTLSLLRLYAM